MVTVTLTRLIQFNSIQFSFNLAWVRILDPVPHVDWVCCWFSSLLQGFFARYSGFLPSSKTSTFQFDLGSEDHRFAVAILLSVTLVKQSWFNRVQFHCIPSIPSLCLWHGPSHFSICTKKRQGVVYLLRLCIGNHMGLSTIIVIKD